MAVSKEARLKFWLCATGLCGRPSVECIRCTLSQQVMSRSLLLCPPAFTTAGGAKRRPDRNRKRVKGCLESSLLCSSLCLGVYLKLHAQWLLSLFPSCHSRTAVRPSVWMVTHVCICFSGGGCCALSYGVHVVGDK